MSLFSTFYCLRVGFFDTCSNKCVTFFDTVSVFSTFAPSYLICFMVFFFPLKCRFTPSCFLSTLCEKVRPSHIFFLIFIDSKLISIKIFHFFSLPFQYNTLFLFVKTVLCGIVWVRNAGVTAIHPLHNK